MWIDTGNGMIHIVGSNPNFIHDLNVVGRPFPVNVQTVPEPGTLMLLGTGLLGQALRFRRAQKRAGRLVI